MYRILWENKRYQIAKELVRLARDQYFHPLIFMGSRFPDREKVIEEVNRVINDVLPPPGALVENT